MSVSDLHEKPCKEILDQCADIYVGYLKRFQYRPAVIKSYLRGIEHFVDWVGRRRAPLRKHRKPSVGFRVGLGDDPVGNLALKEER